MVRGVTNERQGSTDAAADRICGRPGCAGRGPLGLPDSAPGQQGIGRGTPRPGRRSGRQADRYSDAAPGSQHRRLSPGLRPPRLVMPGLDPGIHAFLPCGSKDVDGRDKPGHDEAGGALSLHRSPRIALIPTSLADTVPRAWPAPSAKTRSDDGLTSSASAPGTLVPGTDPGAAALLGGLRLRDPATL